MVDNLIFRNMDLNRELTFGQEPGVDFIYKEDGGVDWGNAPAEHSTYSYPGQIGTSISSTSIKERPVEITAYAYYQLTDADKRRYLTYKERRLFAYEKVKQKKAILNELANPLQKIRIKVGGYYIEGKMDGSPKFGTESADNNMYFCRVILDIFCSNPMFKKETEVKTILSGTNPRFHFPLRIPKNRGIVMSSRLTYQLIPVANEGTVEVGCRIILSAKGEVSTPVVTNVHTGQKVTVNKIMQKGEKIIINTNDGQQDIRGYINDVEYNYFKYWDYENDWMKFPIGTTLVGYSVANNLEGLLDVSIEINPMKFGLENM